MSNTTYATAATTSTATKRAERRARLRGNTVRIAAATVTAVAALALTACGSDNGSGAKTEGKADAAATMEPSATDTPGKDSTNDAGTDDKGATDTTGGAGGTGTGGGNAQTGGKGPGVEGTKGQPTGTPDSQGGTGGGDNARTGGKGDTGPTKTACTVAGTTVRVETTGGTIPMVILRATNTGATACNMYYAPVIGYPGAQSALAVSDSGTPQSVRRLAPGASVTASIALGSEDGTNPHRAKQLTVSLKGATGAALPGQATVPAPAGAGLLLDADSSVSWWGATGDGQ
ncbi:DUF4232 domain-containing protein [Streptomyces zagrosensis]|uniref:DUF4232 domain-containing protein n=1 Tax=Streptomyces zagrosensis TaxID=1042984 RepID=A0A7W9Q5H5_9ACTN|nr:DUF4232 domain-containing protein [Streptomyces zagrosensis]MBB5934010.1 hypothetical protein [Streptomyces zagrosensis]